MRAPSHPEGEESLRTPQAALPPRSALPIVPSPSGLESSVTERASKTPEIIRRQSHRVKLKDYINDSP